MSNKIKNKLPKNSYVITTCGSSNYEYGNIKFVGIMFISKDKYD